MTVRTSDPAGGTKIGAPDRRGFFAVPRVVAITTAIVLVAELVVAWVTAGTPDVGIFESFATTVDRVGPIDIYKLDVEEAGLMVYNHPPLVGWWLYVVNLLTNVGIPFAFLIRFPSILAHAATTLLVFAILRTRVDARVAQLSALLVALSPVLLIISGFHGNNDPVVLALTIAAVWLLVDRRAPALAGLAFSVAMSVKIVPVVALPLLFVVAWRLGRRDLLRFVAGAVPVFVVLWLPVLIMAAPGFVSHVIGYDGSGFPRQWGPYQFAQWLHVPESVTAKYAGKGTYFVLALASLLPAWLVRRAPERAPAALALTLTTFLLLTPGWAPQYTSWVAAAVFFIDLVPAVVFTAGAGVVYLVLYSQFAGGLAWDYAQVTTLTGPQVVLVAFVWLALVPSVVVGLRRLRAADGSAAVPIETGGPLEAGGPHGPAG